MVLVENDDENELSSSSQQRQQADDQDQENITARSKKENHHRLNHHDHHGSSSDTIESGDNVVTGVTESQEDTHDDDEDDMVDIDLSNDHDIEVSKQPVFSRSDARPTSFASSSSSTVAANLDDHFEEQEDSTRAALVVEGQTNNFSDDDDDDDMDHREHRIAELAEFVREYRRTDNNNMVDAEDRELLLRLHDFYRARFLRRQTYKSYRPWGIFGLFAHLADIRLDLRWAEDAAWRRQHGKPFFAWVDFDKLHSKVYSFPLFTIFIMIMSTILLLVSIGLNDGWSIEPVRVNPMLGPKPIVLVRLGALVAVQIVEQNEWYRLFLPMILHAGIIHYIINMLALLFLGTAVERVHGAGKTAFLFVVASVGGNLASALLMPHAISLGASGGIFGLLGVCLADVCVNWKLLTLRDEEENDNNTNNNGGFPYVQVLFFLALDIIISLGIGLTPYIDNFAHVGGFFYGICFGIAFLTQSAGSGFFGMSNHRRRLGGFGSFRILAVILATALLITKTVLLSQSDSDDPIPCKRCRYISCLPFPFGKEDKWWYCDSCEHSSGVIHYSQEESSDDSLELFCPFGDIVTIDLMTKNADPEQVRGQLTSYCREDC